MATKRFEINTEPHVAEIGDVSLRFKPEVFTDELLDAWAEMRESLAVVGDLSEITDDEGNVDISKSTARTRERVARSRESVRGMVASLLIPEDVDVFNGLKLPDRVTLELMRWLLEVYGLRPTGPSSASSTSSAPTTSGDASTDDTSVVESTS